MIPRTAAGCLGRVYSRLSAQRAGRQVQHHIGIQSDGLAQVLLPPSVGAALMAQEAPKNGPQFFELATPQGARTHVGVLDFTAVEGVAALPPHVARNLWGGSGHVPEGEARLTVIYRKLLKGALIIDHILSGILEHIPGLLACLAFKGLQGEQMPGNGQVSDCRHLHHQRLEMVHELHVFIFFVMGQSRPCRHICKIPA